MKHIVRRVIANGFLGALVGVAAQYLLAVFISLKLNLGYLMAYIAALAEPLGGEMNAVLCETALSALLGMGWALAISLRRASGRRTDAHSDGDGERRTEEAHHEKAYQ